MISRRANWKAAPVTTAPCPQCRSPLYGRFVPAPATLSGTERKGSGIGILLAFGAFGLLTLATVALALTVLQEEKQRSYANYQDMFAKTQAQIVARLRHPTGQLALLNPGARGVAGAAVTPLVLPFAAIDFDDKAKAQQ